MNTFFKNIAEVQAANPAVTNGLTLPTLLPSLRWADNTYLLPVLGPEFLERLLKAYSDDSVEEWQPPVIALIQAVSGNLALVDATDSLMVQVGNGGITTQSDSNRKAAFQWQIAELKRSAARRGFAALDQLLALLESKIDDGNFAEWAASDAAKSAAELFVNTAAEFSREVNIRGSRATFQALIPLIRKVERFTLRPLLGTAFFDELKELIVDRELAQPEHAAERTLITEYIRPALTHLVKAQALREHTVTLSGDTVELTPWLATPDGTRQAATSASANIADQLEARAQQAERDGRAYLAALIGQLNSSASESVFATYYASDRYPTPGTTDIGNTAQINTDASDGVFYGL